MAKSILITCTDSMMKQFLEPHVKNLAGNGYEVEIACSEVLNRMAELYELPPVFLGDSGQRHQVAAFCQELDAYLFANRRMKLS